MLLRVLMGAFLRRTPGLAPLLQRCRVLLGTPHKSTLSYCLRQPTLLGLAQALLTRLQQSRYRPAPGHLVALDSMPLTLTATRRHGCRHLNRKTVGGGVLWELWLDAPAGSCPVRLLRLIAGAWHDTQSVADVVLKRGPVYLMDIGFWAIELVGQWLGQGVHFILRANPRDFCFTREKTLSRARQLQPGLKLKHDALVRLGGAQRKHKPRVRLVWACFRHGSHWEELILVSDQLAWSAERILAAYKRREEIDQFHRVLKEAVGLAHLYSFQQIGILLLLHVALLLALLVLLAPAAPARDATLLERLYCGLARIRRGLTMEPGLWRRNMLATHQERGSQPRRRKGGDHRVTANTDPNH